MKFIFLFALALLTISGCEAERQQAETRAAELQTQAKAGIDAKVSEAREEANKKASEAAAEAQKQIMAKVDPQGAMQTSAAKLAEMQTMMGKVKEGKALDPDVQNWIQKQLADSNQAARALAIPVLNQVYAQIPEKRAWLETETREAMKDTDGAVRTAWEDLLTSWARLRTVVDAQR